MPWTPEPPLKDPRAGLAAATCDAPASGSRIYAIGGVDTSGWVATAAAYDTSAKRWLPIAPVPTARAYLVATSGRDGLHALGGWEVGGQLPSQRHDIYDPATDNWSSPASPLPTARGALAAATGRGLIYALGGINASAGGQQQILGTVEAYDPTTGAWNTHIKPMPTPRFLLAAVTGLDGRIYAIGGASGGGAVSTVEAYDPTIDDWFGAGALPAPSYGLAAAVDPQGVIYAIGGFDASAKPQPTVYSYDPASPAPRWAEIAPLPTARAALAAATGPDGLIYALGGFNFSAGGQPQILGAVEAYTKPVPPPPPVNSCLALVTSLDQRLADGGPKVPVQEHAWFASELLSCYQSGGLDLAEYEAALATLNAINKSP